MIYAFFFTFGAFLVIMLMLARPAWNRHNDDSAKLTHEDEDWRLKVKTVDVTGKKRENEEDKDGDE